MKGFIAILAVLTLSGCGNVYWQATFQGEDYYGNDVYYTAERKFATSKVCQERAKAHVSANHNKLRWSCRPNFELSPEVL